MSVCQTIYAIYTYNLLTTTQIILFLFQKSPLFNILTVGTCRSANNSEAMLTRPCFSDDHDDENNNYYITYNNISRPVRDPQDKTPRSPARNLRAVATLPTPRIDAYARAIRRLHRDLHVSGTRTARCR